jgi:hypothetical protein
MAHTLASIRDQVEINLMDSTNLIWSTTILDEAIRASLADLSRAYQDSLFLKDLDSAASTTVDDLDIYVLVKGAVAHALVFRVVGRYEEATPEPNITPALASLAEQRMKEFKAYLIPIYAASGIFVGDEEFYLWKTSENALDRDHDLAMQDDQQLWLSAEEVLNRAHHVAEAALDRAARAGLQEDMLIWKETEAALDRAHKVAESALDRASKGDLQDDQQTWASAEAVLNRAHQVAEAALNRAAKDDLQTDLLLWKSAEAILDRAHKVSEAALDRALKEDLLQAQYDREDQLLQDQIDRLTALQNSDVPPFSQWDVDI